MSLVMPFFVVVLGLFPIILSGYHQFLFWTNNTTNENCKGTFKKLGNPFADQKMSKLCCFMFCKK